jgi:N-acetylneuraminic acid mutarotase
LNAINTRFPLIIICLAVLSACGGGGNSPPSPPTISPASVSFAAQTVGTASTAVQTVTLTNASPFQLHVTVGPIGGTNSAAFSQTNNCGSVATGATCSVAIAFTASVVGANSGTLTLTTNPSFSLAPIPLSGTGLAWTGATWTWLSGSSNANASGAPIPGVYGTVGVAAAANVPGSRSNSISWTDPSGNFWLFGGAGFDSAAKSGLLNDLWKFSPGTGQWTWMGGADTVNAAGVYGTQGVATSGNVPAARSNSVSWTDASGTLWLFGGETNNGSFLNDLWSYNPTSNLWTWVSGSSAPNASGVYGTRNIAAAGNVPGARGISAAWIDSAGNLWLFGGEGYDSTMYSGGLNDLWKFSPTTSLWTWVSGSNVTLYGGSVCVNPGGAPAPSNVPGAISGVNSWIDASGRLWLFGGAGWTGQPGIYTNFTTLWTFDPGSGLWTCSAPSANAPGGVYGTQGVAAAGNVPSGRSSGVSWTDSSGNFWLFGGEYVPNLGGTLFGDLWEYNVASGLWTWVGGTQNGAVGATQNDNGASMYCTAMGTPAGCNFPGPRSGSVSWIDRAGHLFLFGGAGLSNYQGLGNVSILENDIWEYSP